MTPNPNDFPASIFTNTSAFGLMEHADELRRWHEAGGEVSYYGTEWLIALTPSWMKFRIYRAVRPALIKPSVDWSHLLPWVRWVAFDRDDRPVGFEFEPKIGGAFWVVICGGRYIPLTATPGLVRGTVPWTEAIVQRPEGV
jgi:hypothetical protein